MAQAIDGAEVVAIQPLPLDDVLDQRSLQVGAIAVRCGLVRLPDIGGDIER